MSSRKTCRRTAHLQRKDKKETTFLLDQLTRHPRDLLSLTSFRSFPIMRVWATHSTPAPTSWTPTLRWTIWVDSTKNSFCKYYFYKVSTPIKVMFFWGRKTSLHISSVLYSGNLFVHFFSSVLPKDLKLPMKNILLSAQNSGTQLNVSAPRADAKF